LFNNFASEDWAGFFGVVVVVFGFELLFDVVEEEAVEEEEEEDVVDCFEGVGFVVDFPLEIFWNK